MRVVGDSLLGEVEAPICCPSMLSGEVCWGAEIWDDVLSLVWASDFYSLLLFHVDAKYTARGDVEHIKHDYIAVGQVKDIGAWVVSPQSYW